MQKLYTLLFVTILLAAPSTLKAQNDSLVITEIGYNPPESGTDTTEFIELYNAGSTAINLNGYQFVFGVIHTFGNVSINAGDYFVLAGDTAAFRITYGINANDQWTSGGLSNSGESITIHDNLGSTIDSVLYSNSAPWPAGSGAGEPAGGGATIILCDPFSDNNLGANWAASTNVITGKIVNGKQLYGSPGSGESCISPCVNSSSSFSITACSNYSVPSGDSTYTTVGSYTVMDTINNHCGADSLMTISITILPPLTGVYNETVCFGDSIIVNGTTYNASKLTGTEVFTNIGPHNCDSTVTVTLTVQNQIDTSTSDTGLTITSNQTGATYQWIDCDNGNSIISGDTNQSFTATVNGNYAVIITMGNCVDTSACVNISTVSIENELIFKDIAIYPNPNEGIVSIDLGLLKNVRVRVFNTSGKLIYHEENINNSKHQFEINEAAGIYFVEVSSDNQLQNYKLTIK